MPTSEKASQETELTVLKEILRWVKFSGMKEVKGILSAALDTEQKITVYQLSDGSKGIVDIGKAVGIKSTATIFSYWKQWMKLGLGESIPVPGGQRFKRSFDLEDFGFEVQIPSESAGASQSKAIDSPVTKQQNTLDTEQANTRGDNQNG